MKRFVEGVARDQGGLFAVHLEDFVDEDNPVRAVDAFVDKLDLRALGFDAVDPSATGRPGYHPAVLLKLYIYGYLNAVPSSRRLEREAGRNVELMWLTERLAPDHKTIADFRKDHGPAIQHACAQFVMLCRELGLFSKAIVAVDGSKFRPAPFRDHQGLDGRDALPDQDAAQGENRDEPAGAGLQSEADDGALRRRSADRSDGRVSLASRHASGTWRAKPRRVIAQPRPRLCENSPSAP
jgi:transposase